MAQHGGYRQPANPAPSSGPGVFARRTDGRQPIMDLPNAKYGENAQFRSAQAGGAMPQSTGLPGPSPSTPAPSPSGGILGAATGQSADMPTPLPLSGGSLRPDEPVTHGADAGPGADSSSLNLPDPTASQHASALSVVQSLAASPTASPAVRFLASSLNGGF